MLKYVGRGFIPDVPTKDLSEDDVKALPVTKAVLLKSRLYVEEKPPTKKSKKPADGSPTADETGEGN